MEFFSNHNGNFNNPLDATMPTDKYSVSNYVAILFN